MKPGVVRASCPLLLDGSKMLPLLLKTMVLKIDVVSLERKVYSDRNKSELIMSENFQQAAARHLQDSQYLLNQQRWDNAVYLAGYVVECSFKVLVEVYIDSLSAKKYGHDLAELQGKAMERLRLIYPAVDMQLPASRTMGTVLDQDHPARRYAQSGMWSKSEAQQATQRAEEIYLEIIPKLILDGRISI